MGMEDADQEVVTPNPADDAAADADFASGFDTTRALEAPAGGLVLEHGENGKPLVTNPGDTGDADEDPAARAAAEEAARQAAEAEARAQAEAEANAPASITKAQADQLLATAALVPQLQAELARNRDTTAGKLGTLHQQMEAIKGQAAKGQAPTVKQLKRLEAEFPELAQLLKEDLAEQFGAGEVAAPGAAADPGAQQVDGKASGASPGADPTAQRTEPADPLADPRVQQVLQKTHMTVVDTAHPDWRDLTKTDDFNVWRSQLNTDAQRILASSWDSADLVPAFTAFKDWKKQRAAQAEATRQRDKRLEHGVPATTGRATGTNAVDEDAAFLQGFQGARK